MCEQLILFYYRRNDLVTCRPRSEMVASTREIEDEVTMQFLRIGQLRKTNESIVGIKQLVHEIFTDELLFETGIVFMNA